MAWTSFSDVDDRYFGADLDSAQMAKVSTLIAAAERMLASRVLSIQRRLDDGSLDLENVKDAVAAMVLRVIRNPKGFQSETEGNYLYSVQRDVAGGKLYPTGDDLALVRPVISGLYGKPIPSPVPCYRARP